MNEKKEKISEDLKELIIARLEVMPPTYKLSIGNEGTFTTTQLIERVKKGDQIGNEIIRMQLNFIKALTTGKLIETLNKNE